MNSISKSLKRDDFKEVYDVIFDGSHDWQDLQVSLDQDYQWRDDSTYIKEVPFFRGMEKTPNPISDITGARVLLYLGDSVTTDHISPEIGRASCRERA